jgi:hypothetical protein
MKPKFGSDDLRKRCRARQVGVRSRAYGVVIWDSSALPKRAGSNAQRAEQNNTNAGGQDCNRN